jgi:alkylation response protein AidB-like acyl-CoA dehydrogenase
MRSFARTHLAPRAVAADLAPHPSVGQLAPGLDGLVEEAGRAGLFSDLLPRPLGSASPALLRFGLAMPQALKVEEFAAVDGGLMLLLSAHALGVAPVLLGGDLGQLRRVLLPAFRESERGAPHLFAYAITEPGGGSDVEDAHGAATHRPGVTARRVDGGWRLSGTKCYISGGDIAQTIVVFAALEGEGMASWTAFIVRRGDAGLRISRTEHKLGMRASGAAEVQLDEVFVADADVVGGVRRGWALNRATLNLSRIPVGAMGVGLARAATEAAEDFACRFRLADRPLVDYQEIQLALAEMHARTLAARAMVWAAARQTQARQAEASAVKFHVTDTARAVCELAMDLIGNHSILHEERVERALRDARLTQIFEGTNQINRLAVIEDQQDRLLARIAEIAAPTEHRSDTMSRDAFFDVPRTTHTTSQGPVELPILYRDVTTVVPLFTVARAAAVELLADTDLEPVCIGERHAVVGLAFYEYRDTTVGVYNEVGTAMFVSRRGERVRLGLADLLRAPVNRTVGMYVIDLPVTTAIANAAGRELWGYPKFVTAIALQLRGREVLGSVRDPDGDGDICSLRGRLGPSMPVPPLSLMTYSHLDGALMRTHVDVRGTTQAHTAGTVRLTIGESTHPMASRLRALGLDGARPRLVLATDRFQSLLHAGTRLR